MNKKKPIRSILRPIFPSVAVFIKGLGLLYSKRSMLRNLGYIESAKTQIPCKKDGSPIPWMNYHIIQFLEERLTKDLSLFEFGSGSSTMFYASLVHDVTSVESDEKWYTHVKNRMPSNVKLIFYDPEDGQSYCELAEQQNKRFDVVVIDALDRVNCMMRASGVLTARGVIILDDSNAEDHGEAIEYLLSQGFRNLHFEGLKPSSIRAYRTTLFYRPENCLGI